MKDRRLLIFQERLNLDVPELLLQFFDDNPDPHSFPAIFYIKKGSITLEVAKLLKISDYQSYIKEEKYFAFAETFEGCRLFLDMKTKDLQILQEECGNIDRLDITMSDLFYADKTVLK